MAEPFNPFAAIPMAGAAPAAAAAPQQRRLRLKPRDEPAAQTPTQAALDEANLKLKQQELAEAQRKAALAKDSGDAIKVLMTEIGTAADAHRLSRTNRQSTGWGNFFLGAVPETGAKTMNAYLTTLGGNVAFSALQKMREQSPTGGALGNVTVPELEMLRSSEAPLDPQIDPDTFRTSLQTIMDARKRVLFKIPGGREAYRKWRKQWLGFDPYAPKPKAGAGKGKAKPKGGGWSIEEVR